VEYRYGNPRIEKLILSGRVTKAHGIAVKKTLDRRLMAIEAADTLADFHPPNTGPEWCHELKGDRAGSFAMRLHGGMRLVFEPVWNSDIRGERNWSDIRAIVLQEIVDYHDE